MKASSKARRPKVSTRVQGQQRVTKRKVMKEAKGRGLSVIVPERERS